MLPSMYVHVNLLEGCVLDFTSLIKSRCAHDFADNYSLINLRQTILLASYGMQVRIRHTKFTRTKSISRYSKRVKHGDVGWSKTGNVGLFSLFHYFATSNDFVGNHP